VVDERLRRPRICIYVSDFGYGHASREIALTRGLQEALHAEVVVRTGLPAEFMARSLPGVEVLRGQNDPGVVMEGAAVDRERTLTAVERWLASWDGYIAAEKALLRDRQIDLVLSDIAPQPFLAAEELGIPSLGISNFTWHLIYTHLFGKTDVTDRIAEAYRAAEGALLLPLHEPMAVFKDRREVGLVARAVTRDRAEIRRRCGLSEGEPLVYLGGGRSLDPTVFRGLRTTLAGCTLLVPSWTNLPGTVRIPPGETETQDWIAACDLVVSKPGYSTIAEAVQSGVPMALFRREGFSEDDYLIEGVEALEIGEEIPAAAVLDGSWAEDLESLMGLAENFEKIDGAFKRDGTKDCIDMLRELV
jgi:UDP:flavonoid glycosyltransferase YjiC (YdhE family)